MKISYNYFHFSIHSFFKFKTHSAHSAIKDIFVHEFLSGMTCEYLQGGGSIVPETNYALLYYICTDSVLKFLFNYVVSYRKQTT